MSSLKLLLITWDTLHKDFFLFNERDLLSCEFFDVTIFCKDKTIKANQALLKKCSPYFQNIFHTAYQGPFMLQFENLPYDSLANVLNLINYGEIEGFLIQVLPDSEDKVIQFLSKINAPLVNPLKIEKAECSDVPESSKTDCEILYVDSFSFEDEEKLQDAIENLLEDIPANVNQKFDFDFETTNEPSMKKQKIEENSENLRTYACANCEKVFYSKHTLSRHKNLHKGLTKCDHCNQILSSKDALNSHIRRIHNIKSKTREGF